VSGQCLTTFFQELSAVYLRVYTSGPEFFVRLVAHFTPDTPYLQHNLPHKPPIPTLIRIPQPRLSLNIFETIGDLFAESFPAHLRGTDFPERTDFVGERFLHGVEVVELLGLGVDLALAAGAAGFVGSSEDRVFWCIGDRHEGRIPKSKQLFVMVQGAI